MEKKTIGKFIATLRKANGMTQKELGEKLFVSDKTISRWERDECEPELSLIPVIAEIFNISTDELLRGERIPATPISEENYKIKTEKQVKRMLKSRLLNFKNRLLFCLGITILGVLVALLCNFAFYRAILGFCISAITFTLSVILIFYFLENTYLKADNEEDFFIDKETQLFFHTSVSKLCRNFILSCICSFVSTLPFAFVGSAYVGLNFEYWFMEMLGFVLAAFLLCGILYKTVIEKILIDKELLLLSEKEKIIRSIRKSVLKRCGIPCMIAFIVLFSGFFIFQECINAYHFAQPQVFENFESFKTYMEKYVPYGEWTDKDGNINVEIFENAIYPDENPEKEEDSNNHTGEYHTINDINGNVLYTFEWNNRSVRNFEVSDTSDRLPINVYTNAEISMANDTIADISQIFLFAMFADVIVFIVLYTIKIKTKE